MTPTAPKESIPFPVSAAPTRPAVSRRAFLRGAAGVLAAPLLPGCGSWLDSDPGETPSLMARPGNPTVAAEPGLTALGLGTGRDGQLYVPQSYAADTPAPLFVALHGAGGSGGDWAGYHARAEARGMILLAPDSRASTWDLLIGGFGPDVQFLDRALRYTFERCRIDTARIALAGFSDGATYGLSLGVSNGDLFSHLIGYSPGMFRPSGSWIGKPKVYVSHGVWDSVLPVTLGRNIVGTLIRGEYDVTYHEFEGDHEVPAEVSEAALNWFLTG